MAEKKIKFQSSTARLLARKSPYEYCCSVGDPEKQEYQPVYDSKGNWHLEPTKKSNLYAEIQSHYASTDLNLIMERYRNGEVDVLAQIQGFYGDVADIPTNYADILNEKIRAEALFASLNADIRAKFDNSPERFIIQLGNGEAWKILGINPDGSPLDNGEKAPASPIAEGDGNNG